MTNYIRITDCPESTLLGMNGGQPESPDGKRIVYAKKADLTRPETEICICNSDFTEHRTVFKVLCGNHNSVSATFVDNSRIVFRDSIDKLAAFRILDVDTGEVVYGPIFGKESHCAEGDLYPFSISPEYVGKNKGIDECGVFTLNLKTGEIKRVVAPEDLSALLDKTGVTMRGSVTSMSHVQLNPTGTAVMMRLGIVESPVFGGLGYFNFENGESHLMLNKPVHQLWYDADTYMATRQFCNNGIIEMASSYIARFTPDGKEVEVLGGIGNHIDGSPDRNWFCGDRCYPGYSPDIFLYKKGIKEPVLTEEIPDFQHAVWKLQVHPNPTFSRDGKRIYFNRPSSDSHTDACYIDISDIVKEKSST